MAKEEEVCAYEFKKSILFGMLRNQYCFGPDQERSQFQPTAHGSVIGRFEPGSSGKPSDVRRYVGNCRHCQDHLEWISYYCKVCIVCLHPECFHQNFNQGKPENFRPTQPVNPVDVSLSWKIQKNIRFHNTI